LTGIQGAADHELRRIWEHDLVDDLTFSQKVCHRHISQYLKFLGILEIVSHQLFGSPMICSEPPNQQKTTCLFGC